MAGAPDRPETELRRLQTRLERERKTRLAAEAIAERGMRECTRSNARCNCCR